MSKFLYALGKKAYDKPWTFILIWVVVLGIVGTVLGINGVHISSEMKIEGTNAQQVLDKLKVELPQASGGRGSAVFTVPKGERLDTPERLNAITKAVNEVYNLEYVINTAKLMEEAAKAAAASAGGAPNGAAAQGAAAQGAAGQGAQAQAAQQQLPYGPLMINGVPVPGVIISADASVALFQFQFTVQESSVPAKIKEAAVEAVTKAQEGTGMKALPSESLNKLSTTNPAEVIGLVVAAVVLLTTLGSIVAAGLPLMVSLIGVGVGVGGAFAISKFFHLTSVTPVLALMIGLAVGIDYSLFIVNRQRRLILDQGLSSREAASRAVGTSGSAVLFAGLTVIIALCGMLVMGIKFLSAMALVAAATVLICVLLSLTLLPALLGLVRERICTAKERAHAAENTRHNVASKWAKSVIRYRWLLIVAIIAILGGAAIPFTQMDLGFPSGATANLDSTSRQSYDATSTAFGEGFNGPLVVVAELADPSGKVTPALIGGIVQELQKNKDVSLVTPMGVNQSGNMAIMSIIPKSGPGEEDTKSLVKELRSPDSDIAQKYKVVLGVTGMTAMNIDMSAKLSEVFPIYVGIIVILSCIILLLVFRSILVPVKATAGFVLSILATFGITTAVFQWGWLHSLFGFDTGGPLLSFMPIMVTGILYGLAMDYQVFLVSSMRESYIHGYHGREAVVHGYEQASRVVVAAAVIMVFVFGGFILAHDIMIKQIGFALTIGILIDAFIIRMTLVPALMALFGDKAWWIPRWLDRLLPNLDVEGDKLMAELKAQDARGEQR
ncbi:MMPL family transporter [Gorillibacterium sp. sgz5001074]|uniref:MMPL family transporter n=1 Tax=Gorillibacterium sp. sgz5001074 TaxID=3446695 RepID=UPI003F677205